MCCLQSLGATLAKGLTLFAFLRSSDYIFTLSGTHRCLRQSLAQHLVVEPSSVRGLAADCPICIIFKPSYLAVFHACIVVYAVLRGSQQFNGMIFRTPFSERRQYLIPISVLCSLQNLENTVCHVSGFKSIMSAT